MAIELGPAVLLQVDATVITGILILLTLVHLKTTIDNKDISTSVSYVVVPFGISAILILFSSCECFGIDEYLVTASKYIMIGGFVYVIFAVITITRTKKKSKESSNKKS